MNAELVVSSLPGEVRTAVLRDDVLEDLLILRDERPLQAGDRFFAKVQRFDKGLEAAFVDLGEGRPALLPRRELSGEVPPEGTALAVAVIRAPSGDKGPRVSAKRVAVAKDELAGLKAPQRLPDGASPLLDLMAASGASAVTSDDPQILRQLKGRAENSGCDFALHADATPLFEAWGLEEQIEGLLQPRVDGLGGGSLLIEPVQTLTAIDVNAGRHDGRGGGAAQAREVNLALVPEIARQLRLRALSGLIVIDFLEVQKPEDRKAVAAALRQAVAADPEPCQIFGISPSGLLEMTRRRGRAPLHELLCRPCGLGGRGWEKTPATLAYEALRHLAAARGRALGKILLRASPEVAAALQGGQAAALAAVEQRLGRAVTLEADPLIENHDLVLG